ncbi:MAG TPA: GNAT family N-acetyltransferase [Caulobacteraceae bacterium]|jgi:ribosomal protein S18 acetylase RimI-like enzyme
MSRAQLIPDLDLVARCQAIIGGYTATRVQIVADRPGDPRGAGVRRWPGAVACRCPMFGENMFNRGFGFSDATLDAAGEAIAWYEEWKVPAAFEVAPGPPGEALMALLAGHGYRQTGFHTAFAGWSDLPDAPGAGVEVRRVESSEDLAAFSDVYHAGWDITGFRVPMAPWLAAPGWRLYLGLCGGEPAGAAILYLDGGDAYLADGAVDPRFRGRGVHRALLDRRCADAVEAGAQVVFSGADYLNGSCRNMIRKGLGILYTKAIWTRRLPGA